MRTTSGENGLECFAVGVRYFLVVCWQKIYEYVKKFDSGLVRNISTELYHVLIMLTRGRAQRLVLKAAEPELWKRTAFFSDDTN